VLPEKAIRWVTDVIGPGSRILSARHLTLGDWHVNHALAVIDARGHTHRLVLRRWARPGWEAEDPGYTVDREVRVLTMLASTPVPAPMIVAADPTGACCDVPAILLTRLAGRPPRLADADLAGCCRQLAQTLVQIHDVNGAVAARLDRLRLSYDRAHAALVRWIPITPVWTRAIAAVRQRPPAGTVALLHRDYHPENTLWSRGRLAGVVDWTQASAGPPEFDVGHMRWNLVASHGQQAADWFLDYYQAAAGTSLSDQPYWDLAALFDLLLDGDDPGDIVPADLRTFEDYAETVLGRWH
jgi:aminoglycoside phosphotransferase (APT) family kinase protein